MSKEIKLPKFDIVNLEDGTWFAIVEGELEGLMFRVVEGTDDGVSSNDSLNLAYDYSFNKFWMGGESAAAAKLGKIKDCIEGFINVAIEATLNEIEAGNIKLDAEKTL